MTWLKQARVLAPSEKQKEIDEKMQEVQKQASEGSLFGMVCSVWQRNRSQ